jgi:DNA-directed RNA polymerase specialized sigma24 family protein
LIFRTDGKRLCQARSPPPPFGSYETTHESNGGNQMFDKKNDYFINKREADSIVCKSVTGTYIRLTREDFSSEEEFQKWKEWSDKDYQEAEKVMRKFYDYGIPWEEAADAINPVVSAEERFFEELERMEQEMLRAEQAERQIAGIRQALTRTQFRRFWLHHAEGMSVEQIAVAEGVSHQNISKSLLAARKKIKKFLKKL